MNWDDFNIKDTDLDQREHEACLERVTTSLQEKAKVSKNQAEGRTVDFLCATRYTTIICYNILKFKKYLKDSVKLGVRQDFHCDISDVFKEPGYCLQLAALIDFIIEALSDEEINFLNQPELQAGRGESGENIRASVHLNLSGNHIDNFNSLVNTLLESTLLLSSMDLSESLPLAKTTLSASRRACHFLDLKPRQEWLVRQLPSTIKTIFWNQKAAEGEENALFCELNTLLKGYLINEKNKLINIVINQNSYELKPIQEDKSAITEIKRLSVNKVQALIAKDKKYVSECLKDLRQYCDFGSESLKVLFHWRTHKSAVTELFLKASNEEDRPSLNRLLRDLNTIKSKAKLKGQWNPMGMLSKIILKYQDTVEKNIMVDAVLDSDVQGSDHYDLTCFNLPPLG